MSLPKAAEFLDSPSLEARRVFSDRIVAVMLRLDIRGIFLGCRL